MSLKQKTIKGLFWTTLSQVGKQLSQLVVIAILANLLVPRDFGLVSMALVFLHFINLVAELGFSYSLIQKKDAKDIHYCSAFWLNIVLGILLALTFYLSAPLIAAFYTQPALEPILKVLSATVILSSLIVVQQAILMRNMEFRKLATRDISAYLIGGIIGIAFAYNGFGVWSLVAQAVTFYFFNAVLLWFLSKWRPKMLFSFRAIREIFKFSSHVTLVSIIHYFSKNIDQLLIGKFLGSEALGYYSIAYRLMLYPLQIIYLILHKVMFPSYSLMQDSVERIASAFKKVVQVVGFTVFPMLLGLFVIAPEFITYVYGAKWEAAVILVRILCFAGIFEAIGDSILGPIRLALGRSGLHLKMSIIYFALLTISISSGLNWGTEGVATAYAIVVFIWFLINSKVTFPLIEMNSREYFRQIWIPVIINIIMLSSLLILRIFLNVDSLTKMIVLVLSGIIIYIALLFISKQIILKDNRLVLALLHGKLQRDKNNIS